MQILVYSTNIVEVANILKFLFVCLLLYSLPLQHFMCDKSFPDFLSFEKKHYCFAHLFVLYAKGAAVALPRLNLCFCSIQVTCAVF